MALMTFNSIDPVNTLINKLNLLAEGSFENGAGILSLQQTVKIIQDTLLNDDTIRLLSFTSVDKMVSYLKLLEGNNVLCFGKSSYNDGEFRYFKIVNDPSLVPNGDTILALEASSKLRAVLVVDKSDSGDLAAIVAEHAIAISKNATDIVNLKTSATNNANAINAQNTQITTVRNDLNTLTKLVGDSPQELDPDHLTKAVPINMGGTGVSVTSSSQIPRALDFTQGLQRAYFSLVVGTTFSTSLATAESGQAFYFYNVHAST